MTVRLKNAGDADVTLTGVRFYGHSDVFYCPVSTGNGKTSVVIPADGDWHDYSFDLNQLGVLGSPVDRWSNEALDAVTEVRLCFSGKGAVLRCDEIRFAPEDAAGSARSASSAI